MTKPVLPSVVLQRYADMIPMPGPGEVCGAEMTNGEKCQRHAESCPYESHRQDKPGEPRDG